jgi:hypothetical protein
MDVGFSRVKIKRNRRVSTAISKLILFSAVHGSYLADVRK